MDIGDVIKTVSIWLMISAVILVCAFLIHNCTLNEHATKVQCYETNKHRQAAEVILICGKLTTTDEPR